MMDASEPQSPIVKVMVSKTTPKGTKVSVDWHSAVYDEMVAQTKALTTIRSILIFFTVLTVLAFIAALCNALMTF